MENEPTPPRPIDDGRVDQTVVEYTGGLRGAMTYRGPSGRQYRFDALPSGRRKYVLEEDLEYFRCLVHFRVLKETRIDPERQRRKKFESRVITKVAELLNEYGPPRKRRGHGKRGGRPPIALEELQRLWHLRHHCLPPWSIEALATEFLGDDYATPHATISTRLSRLKKSHPDLIREDDCPWCAKGYAPDPPARS